MANMAPPVTRNVHSPHASFSKASGSARQSSRSRWIAGSESSYIRGCAMVGSIRSGPSGGQAPVVEEQPPGPHPKREQAPALQIGVFGVRELNPALGWVG